MPSFPRHSYSLSASRTLLSIFQGPAVTRDFVRPGGRLSLLRDQMMAEQHPRPLSPAQSRPSQPGHCQASGVRVEDIFTWPSKCYTLLNRFHCPAQDRRWTKSSPPHSHHVAEFHRDRILLLSRREESSRRRDKFEELRLHVQPNPHGPRPFRMPRQRYMVVTTWIHYAAATGGWRAHSCLLSSQPGTSCMSGERGWRTGGSAFPVQNCPKKRRPPTPLHG